LTHSAGWLPKALLYNRGEEEGVFMYHQSQKGLIFAKCVGCEREVRSKKKTKNFFKRGVHINTYLKFLLIEKRSLFKSFPLPCVVCYLVIFFLSI
jgi:hypothetical protein